MLGITVFNRKDHLPELSNLDDIKVTKPIVNIQSHQCISVINFD